MTPYTLRLCHRAIYSCGCKARQVTEGLEQCRFQWRSAPGGAQFKGWESTNRKSSALDTTFCDDRVGGMLMFEPGTLSLTIAEMTAQWSSVFPRNYAVHVSSCISATLL